MYNIHRDGGLVKMRIKKEINKKKETTDVDVALFIYIFVREKDT